MKPNLYVHRDRAILSSSSPPLANRLLKLSSSSRLLGITETLKEVNETAQYVSLLSYLKK